MSDTLFSEDCSQKIFLILNIKQKNIKSNGIPGKSFGKADEITKNCKIIKIFIVNETIANVLRYVRC